MDFRSSPEVSGKFLTRILIRSGSEAKAAKKVRKNNPVNNSFTIRKINHRPKKQCLFCLLF
jgi:hypothetical protein